MPSPNSNPNKREKKLPSSSQPVQQQLHQINTQSLVVDDFEPLSSEDAIREIMFWSEDLLQRLDGYEWHPYQYPASQGQPLTDRPNPNGFIDEVMRGCGRVKHALRFIGASQSIPYESHSHPIEMILAKDCRLMRGDQQITYGLPAFGRDRKVIGFLVEIATQPTYIPTNGLPYVLYLLEQRDSPTQDELREISAKLNHSIAKEKHFVFDTQNNSQEGVQASAYSFYVKNKSPYFEINAFNVRGGRGV